MATQKVNYEGLESFISENKNRFTDIVELAQSIEECFTSIEADSCWLGNNAEAFYDATDQLFNSGSIAKNMSDDSLRILDYLEKVLTSVQNSDSQTSKDMVENTLEYNQNSNDESSTKTGGK